MKPKVLINVRFLNLPNRYLCYYAQIGVAVGGYIHDKDKITTEYSDSINPVFQTNLKLEYIFEEKQDIKVELFGISTDNKKVQISTSHSTVGRVIHSGGHLAVDINTDNDVFMTENVDDRNPKCIYEVKEDTAYKENIEIKLQGYGLDKKDLFGKSDPYIKFYKKTEKGKLIQTYRSEIIKNNLNPDWKPVQVSLDRFSNKSLDTEIIIRCFDWDGAKGDPEDLDNEFDEIIGEFSISAKEFLLPYNQEKKFELINPRKKKKKKGYVNSGMLIVNTAEVIRNHSFIDYMFGGTDLNFIVAIDLTSSNGDVHDPNSLHYVDENCPNEYSVAIQAVLEILQEYDNDEMFPAFGFGARIAPDYKVCHEYPLTGDFSNPFCRGVEGVIAAYHQTLQHIKLSGPTYFGPVVRQVINLAKQYRDGTHYFVLLILTDGTVDDWIETKKAVIEASFLPISIIVVGVGGGKFLDMKTLDQDFGLLKVGNDQACRDSVQFVPMRKFLRPAADGTDNVKWSKVALAKEVLAELPEQVSDYMKRNSIRPIKKQRNTKNLSGASSSYKKESVSISSLSGQLDPPKPNNQEHRNLSRGGSTSGNGSGQNLQQQKLRRCATTHYNNSKSASSTGVNITNASSSTMYLEQRSPFSRKTSTDMGSPSHNTGRIRTSRKCSVDSQFIEEMSRHLSQHRGSFSEQPSNHHQQQQGHNPHHHSQY